MWFTLAWTGSVKPTSHPPSMSICEFGRHLVWIVFLVLTTLTKTGLGNFHPGDFVQTSRRAQFHGQRTHWHDLLGYYCPRFGQHQVVSLPLPKPKGYEDVDDYKVQFSFDHERLVTSWITVVVKHPKMVSGWEAENAEKAGATVLVPFVNVMMYQRADKLMKVKAHSFRLPEKYLQVHPNLVEEYRNASEWPKHLMIKFMWADLDEIDADQGLTVLLIGGILALGVAMFGVLVTYKDKFADFIRDVAVEQIPVLGPGGEKSE